MLSILLSNQILLWHIVILISEKVNFEQDKCYKIHVDPSLFLCYN